MNRRQFLETSAVSLSAAGLSFRQDPDPVPGHQPFRLNYAPPLGMFDNHARDPLDQIRCLHDLGFRAIEDNGMKRRPAALQEKIGALLQQLGMEMGVFVANADFGKVTFASNDSADTEKILADLRESLEVAKRVGARWCTVVPGRYHQGVEWDYQTARVIENLRRAAAICEPSGLCMVLEPLNPWRDHPGLFLTKIPQAYLLCRAVQSPSCKILFDIYHQQITEGNLIPNIDRAWDEIAYFQIGDNPGRQEPTTGEINYRNVFKHIHAKGYQGVLGMEHGKSKPGKEGELAVVEAYRWSDGF
jgi:hydroxypyruvate isomerase